MRFSRHAKNRMRSEKFFARSVEKIVAYPERWRVDERGNPIAVGRDEWGRAVEVVIALDDPGYVITVVFRRNLR